MSERVYFIGDGRGHIKIGCSNNPGARIATLQTGTVSTLELLATMRGGREEESCLHGMFTASRVTGEWFRRTELLDGIIAQANEWPNADFDDVLHAAAETLDAENQFGRILYSEHEWAGALHGRARPESEDFA